MIGRYVRAFAEATHALPQKMPMNADYPFKLSAIQSKDDTTITIVGRGGQTATLPIQSGPSGEFCVLVQSSTFERFYGRKPTKFQLLPFRETE